MLLQVGGKKRNVPLLFRRAVISGNWRNYYCYYSDFMSSSWVKRKKKTCAWLRAQIIAWGERRLKMQLRLWNWTVYSAALDCIQLNTCGKTLNRGDNFTLQSGPGKRSVPSDYYTQASQCVAAAEFEEEFNKNKTKNNYFWDQDKVVHWIYYY